MSAVVVLGRRRGGKWSLSERAAGEGDHIDADLMARATARGRGLLRELYAELGSGAGVWRFELSKVYVDGGEVVLGLSEEIADVCLSADRAEFSVCVAKSPLLLRQVARSLTLRGERVAGALLSRHREQWRWRVAGILAFSVVLLDALRYGAFRPISIGALDRDLALAVHGEWSTRTRHLLGVMEEQGGETLVLVLGRPRLRFAPLITLFAGRLGHSRFRLIRPFSLGSTVRAIPSAWRRLSEGRRSAMRCGVEVTWHALAAMSYRCAFGSAMSVWWSENRLRPRRVAFGHTGIADTSLLELAVQEAGVETIHVVHGVSAGVNLTGCSSVGLFRCGHDADWHSRLGGYGKCRAVVAERPALQQGETGLLLLTNLAHPMNPEYRLTGIADELSVMEAVAAASKGIPDGPPRLNWRPHPITSGLGHGQYEALLARAVELGYERVPNDADLLGAARSCRYLLCTASTVVIDLLAAGMLPILLDWQSVDPECALGQYPLRAQDEASLRAALACCLDPAERSRLYDAAWTSIRPAGPLRLSGLCDDGPDARC